MLIRINDMENVIDLMQFEDALVVEIETTLDDSECGVFCQRALDDLMGTSVSDDPFLKRYAIAPTPSVGRDGSLKHEYLVTYVKHRPIRHVTRSVLVLTEFGPTDWPELCGRRWILNFDLLGMTVVMPDGYNAVNEVMGT